ncbi:hypothetical protein PBY51_017905 [Eleginops maclovinus]|uniref:Uncharacterized protein n=1 Tax=Eleginops maclovinus TaxID=56733 RepID=A0AAN7XJY6_ELEMC|nr:hypothetical protein PBY51_017905 [Eleginops maclovinus]
MESECVRLRSFSLSLCPKYSLHTGPTSRESGANPHEPRTCWPDLDNRLGQATSAGAQTEQVNTYMHSSVQHGEGV